MVAASAIRRLFSISVLPFDAIAQDTEGLCDGFWPGGKTSVRELDLHDGCQVEGRSVARAASCHCRMCATRE
jgi:hypothetical protein